MLEGNPITKQRLEAAGCEVQTYRGNELSLKAEGGQTVFQTREERDSSELAGGPGGYGFTTRVPLKDVAPVVP